MYLLFAFAYLSIAWHIPPLTPVSTINNISGSYVFFKDACHANPGPDKK